MGKEVLTLGNMDLTGASDIKRHKSNTLAGSLRLVMRICCQVPDICF